MRSAGTPDPPQFLRRRTPCAACVFRVTVQLLQLQLADLHSNQEKGNSKNSKGRAPAVCPTPPHPLRNIPREPLDHVHLPLIGPCPQLQLTLPFPPACLPGSHQAYPFSSSAPHLTPHLPTRGSLAPSLTKVPHHSTHGETEASKDGGPPRGTHKVSDPAWQPGQPEPL